MLPRLSESPRRTGTTKMKRSLSLLLSLILLFSLAGCTGSTADPEHSGENPPATEAEESVDFYGYKVRIVNWFYNDTMDGYSLFGYKANTLYRDIAAARLEEIKAAYNCDIAVESYPGSMNISVSVLSAMSDGPDITYAVLNDNIKAMTTGGLLVPLEDYKDILDYENSLLYGPVGQQEPAIYKGKPYMVTPYSHPERQFLVGQLCVFNEKLTEERSTADLRELNEKKAWNWEAFETFLTDTTVREEGKTVQYGISSLKSIFSYLALVNNGYTLAVSDGNGGWKSGAREPNVVESINWCKKIFSEYKDCFVEMSSWDDGAEKLARGAAVMTTQSPDMIVSSISFEVERFGLVPFPYGPDCEYGTAVNNSGIQGLGINLCSDEPEVAAYVIAAYCQPFAEYPTLEDALNVYDNIFFDKRDIDVLLNMSKYCRASYYSFGGMYFSDAIGSQCETRSAAEIVEKNARLADVAVEEYVAPNMDYISAHIGK